MTQKVSDEELGAFARKQNDWFTRVRAGSLDPQEVGNAVQAIIDRGQQILHQIATTAIAATDGTETIVEATDVFAGYIDPDFKKWGLNKPGKKTKKTNAAVLEQRKDATFQQMFGATEAKWRPKLWQQSQIVAFCRDNRNLLHSNGWATFFPFEVDGLSFVARVNVYEGARWLRVYVSRFEFDFVWDGTDRYRVVLPQRALGI